VIQDYLRIRLKAMISCRPYCAGLPFEEVPGRMTEASGTQFDGG
jgi:hypothetical protein